MQLVWINTTTGDEQRHTVRGRSVFLRLTRSGELKTSVLPTPLRIEIEGQNVFVLDTSDFPPISVAGMVVEKGRQRVWARNQDLRIGANVVFWVANSTILRSRTPIDPEQRRRRVAVTTVLTLLLLLFGCLGYRAMTANNTVQAAALNDVAEQIQAGSARIMMANNTVQAATSTPIATPMATPIGTLSLTDVLTSADTPTPIVTLTPTPTLVPITVVSPLHAPATPTPDPPPPPTVSIVSSARPEMWDERLDALSVNFVPAIVPVGGEFWRLYEARWLDEREATGRHHIFVDVVDAQQRRFQEREVRIRVSTDGSLTACMPAVDPNIQRPFGADCPMFSSGFAYTVAVDDSLPSDRVERLGLGTIEDRFAPIHTSYILRFRLEQRTNN